MTGSKARQILDMNAYRPAADGAAAADPALARRLANVGAAAVLFYDAPIQMVAGEGAWMIAADGSRYLDFYNNVPSVGHTHPAVVAAVQDQIARLNINSRYLSPVVDDYLEALKAKLPADLSNIVLTCSGSEANDLAMRVAARASGGTGFVVTRNAYHGNTAAVTEISPSAFKRGAPADHVAQVPEPDPALFGTADGAGLAEGFAAAVRQAIAELAARGHRPAALVCDSIFSSDGVHADPPGFLAPAVAAMREAGGLFIADEVQPGFARTGDHFWGFGRHGLSPDIVTMGKPMGNGFPMAGMAARPDLVAAFCEDVGYFNTFGANPVAAAAGHAVLRVIAEEGLQANAATVGAHLMSRLRDMAARDRRISAVRGAGLFIGVDLEHDGAPAPDLATAVINGLKREHVLIGAAGRFGHTLKVRPPLCLGPDEADIFADALERVLAKT
ncbi:aspartate aminotransferase family protein [Marinibaculum pumilum]|uniref:Aspartate aminotransferase family protein n=1 Tax=Marinibaculum pumilum TaxID=1766165 RepID=A0ABV7LB53_9PROT